MKYSAQRELILNAVRRSCSHPTADMIYEMVKPEAPHISLATVYRNLNQLSECGEIKKIPVAGSGDRFDKRMDFHGHIICNKCGAVSDIELYEFKDISDIINKKTGFQVTGTEMVFTGLCEACK